MSNLLHTEKVKFCIFSGDPGCLGWPDWHYEDCVYREVDCTFCECGGNDVYGEMWHEDSCPLCAEYPPAGITPNEADPPTARTKEDEYRFRAGHKMGFIGF